MGDEIKKKEDVKPADGLVSANVAEFLKQNANSGMESMSYEDVVTPYMIMIQPGTPVKDSEGNRLSNGHSGEFYHMELGKCFKKVDVTLLAVGKRMFEDKDQDGTIKDVYTAYLVLGVLNGDERVPFVFKAKRTAIGAVKKMNTEVKKSRRPIWSMTAELTTAMKTKTDKDGKTFEYFVPVINFTGMINSIEELNAMKKLAETYKDLVQGSNEVDLGPEVEADDPIFDEPAPTEEETEKGSKEDVNPDDIPF